MSRKFVRISKDAFKDKLEEAIKVAWNTEYHGDFSDFYYESWPDKPNWYLNGHQLLNFYHNQIKKDLSKVQFDLENCDWDCDWGNKAGRKLHGLRTLDNGLTYLGISAGGDWEFPVFYIFYWDGTSLRAYIPKDGNIWNRTTKQAYGNDEDDDLKDAIKQKLIPSSATEFDSYTLNLDWERIEADIKKRITE